MDINNKKGISVIVPFYYGNKHLVSIYNCLELICEYLADVDIELIVVNDSPEIKVTEPSFVTAYKYIIINNEKNSGIHYSRVNGLKHASKEWIQFLDQDDYLVPQVYKTQIEDCDEYDWIICNGINVYSDGEKKLYKNRQEMNYLIKEQNFLKGRNYIRSPGQCLIRKKCIPSQWITDIVQNNGSDDLFLWMLMFADGARIRVNDTVVYHHNQQNGENLSRDQSKIRASSLEVCDKLDHMEEYPKSKAEQLRRICEFRYAYLSGDKSFIDKTKYAELWIRGASLYAARVICSIKK